MECEPININALTFKGPTTDITFPSKLCVYSPSGSGGLTWLVTWYIMNNFGLSSRNAVFDEAQYRSFYL